MLYFYFLSLSLIFVPLRYWDQLKELFASKFVIFFSEYSRNYYNGLQLYEVSQQYRVGQKISSLPVYKFFHDVLYGIIDASAKYGQVNDSIFQFFKNVLMKDIQHERKKRSDYFSSYLQFILASFCIICTITFSNYILEKAILSTAFCIVILAHTLGIIIYFKITQFIEKSTFLELDKVFNSLMKFSFFSQMNLPISIVLEKTNVPKFVGGQEVKRFRASLVNIIERWQSAESFSIMDTERLLDNVWDYRKYEYKKMLRKLVVWRLVILAVFYLSSYLIYFATLFNSFLVQ